MNKFIAIFLTLLSLASCEPPRESYGPPSYSYESSSASASTQYISQPLGHQTSEGLHIDDHLLETVKQVILNSENSGSSASIKPLYGPPSHWSDRVVAVDFAHPIQSVPIAYYLGKTYAPQWQESSSGHASTSAGWSGQTSAIFIEKPTSNYGVPKW
ncbi:hypothetical protein PVAND_017204 [Polypedilum vanderplanki]|uniref:Uncharacterized protein n=1 Tax=Polypedilum vanderplanki TaxID=319348 RepID=A0A9J6BHK6_POLVA|nr:hypothetical protein PVAND_017204 [Polypedilum vanderplanki]